MGSQVERFTGTADEWNAFASAQAGFTHFHRLEWMHVVQRALRHECFPLAVRTREGALEGVLLLVRVRSVLFGHYLVSMPFLNYGGPLGSEDAIRALVAHAVAQADAERVKLLELRCRSSMPIDLPVSHRKITVVLDLGRTPEETFKRFDAKLRSQVRRPQKEGVEVRFGPDQVEPFFHVFAEHMRDLGTPTQSVRLFHAIAAAFPDTAWFACAWLRGMPVAGGCGFHFGDEFEMTWASSLRAFNREAPNMLVYWSMMERAIAAGVRRFNFGRCTPGSGTHRFKQQWGGVDEPLWWYGRSSEAGAHTPSPSDGAYSWGPRLWSKLPLRVATAIGPSIVRYIP